MVVITTPTGHIGRQLLARLLDGADPVRVIARDAARLDPVVRERVEVIEGSHEDPTVLDRALAGAEAVFWLVPPDAGAPSAEAHYLAFARAGTAAIRRHGVEHVVAVSSAGHGWTERAGLLSAAFAMDTELERSYAAYRALCMPFYMENLLDQLDAIREQGVFSLTHPANQPLASVATRDIADTAAALLTDRSWAGQEKIPVFGPSRMSPSEMAGVMSEVLGRSVAYRQTSLDDFEGFMAARGGSEQTIQDLTEMFVAQANGIYDADRAAATPTATSFRNWCQVVLRPAANA